MAYPTLIELDFSTGQNTPNYIDNCDQYPESLVRYFIENYTKKGQSVFDPFIGFGTTAFVAEETGRIPFGIEADGERFEWGAGQLENWQNIKHDDAANIAAQDFPEMDFCMTSPPYMIRDDEWNPLYGGDPEYNGYDVYLKRLEFIFAQVATIMKKDALIVVQADNIQGKIYTPLVRDFHHLISKSFKPQAEIIVRWTGEKPECHKDYEHTHCLVFKKI
jgi:DNA modification methylase